MSNLTVWAFDAVADADATMLVVQGLADRGQITLHDAVSVSWSQGQHKPHLSKPRRNKSRQQGPDRLDPGLVASTERSLGVGRSALLLLTADGNVEELRRSIRWSRGHLVASEFDDDALRKALEEMISG